MEVSIKIYKFSLFMCIYYLFFIIFNSWNEWMTLPIEYKDLPRSALLAMTIYDCGGLNKMTPIGGTTISLFSKYGVFRQGMLDLRVWPNRVADGTVPTTTPGKTKDNGKEQMQRLAKLAKKHRNGIMTKVRSIFNVFLCRY